MNTDFECALLIFAFGFLMSIGDGAKTSSLPGSRATKIGFGALCFPFVLFAFADLIEKFCYALGIPGSPAAF